MTITSKKRVDFRILLGVVVVVISALVGAFLFSSATRTTAVYVASTSLSTGQHITESDVSVIEMQLGSAEDHYVRAGQLAPGSIVQQPIRSGELVPVAALGTRSDQSRTHVVLPVSASLSEQIRAGATVEIWAAMSTEQGVFAPPALLVGEAEVVDVHNEQNLGLSAGTTNVEVIIPRSKAVGVMDAQANGDVISLLPIEATD